MANPTLVLSTSPPHSDFHQSDLQRLRSIEELGMEESQRSRSRGAKLIRATLLSQQQRQWQPLALSGQSVSHSAVSPNAPFSNIRASSKRRSSPYVTTGGGYGRATLTAASPMAPNNAFLQSIQSPSNIALHFAPWTPVPNYDLALDNNHVSWDSSSSANYGLPSSPYQHDLSIYLDPNQGPMTQEDNTIDSATISPHSQLDHLHASNPDLLARSQESYPAHPGHSADLYPTPAHDGVPSSSSSPLSNDPSRTCSSSTTEAKPYMGVTMSSELETVILTVLSVDPMYLSPDAEKAYLETRSTHTRWTNHEKNKTLRFFFGKSAQIPSTSKAPLVLPQNIKRHDDTSWEWYDLSERVLNHRRPPSALLLQYKKLEGVYFHLLLTFRKTITDSTVTVLREIENAIVSAGILGVRGCPIKTPELVSWIAGGEESWFAIVHDRCSGSPDVGERLKRFQEKTLTPHSGQCASTIGSSEFSSRQLADGNSVVFSVVSCTSPPHKSGTNTSTSQSGDQLDGVGDGVDRAERAATAEAFREEVAGIRADTGFLIRKSEYLRILTRKTQIAVARSIISDDIVENDKKYERCSALLLAGSPIIDEKTVQAANECVQQYIHSPPPSTRYPMVLRQIGEPSAATTMTADFFSSNSLSLAVNESTTASYHGLAAESVQHSNSLFAADTSPLPNLE